MPEKMLGDLSFGVKHKQGDFNPDMPGETVKHQKTGQDFTKNSAPGGDQQAFPTPKGGLSSNDVANPNDNSLIKEFTKPNKFGRTSSPELYK